MSLASEFLAEAARAASGVHRFWIAAGRPRLVEIQINPSADSIHALRLKAASISSYTMEGMVGEWRELIGPEGVSPYVASGMAYALAAKTAIYAANAEWDGKGEPVGEKEVLSEIGLLSLARKAGGVFDVLTREIQMRVNGLGEAVEVEATTKLGEDSPLIAGG